MASASASASVELTVMFFPHFMSSHIIPLADMARLFAKRGVNVTIVTTPYNALLFKTSIDRDIAAGRPIKVHNLKFPSAEVGLPEGIENFSHVTSMDVPKVYRGVTKLRKPMEQLIRETRPDCIVSDMFFHWTTDIADELKIPRLAFYASNFFFQCVRHNLKLYAPHEKVESETENFVIPGLPDKIVMTRSQLEEDLLNTKTKTVFAKFQDIASEASLRSYGVIMNSFEELEGSYIKHFKTVLGRKGWAIGPVSLVSDREKIVSKHSCLSWLDTQKPNSVVYVCFGSMVRFSDSQLTEIAFALEAAKHPFVWAVRKRGEADDENWLPEGFEGRNKGAGMIVRGWVPQVEILDHPAIGAFLTHTGASSVVEAVTAGVPLITWPLFSEQFYCEKLTNQVLNIGVEVGAKVWNSEFEINSPVVGKDNIEKAVNFLMGGSQEAEEIRRRATELGKLAKKAVEEGGSSYSDLTALIDELKGCAFEKKRLE